MHGPKVYPSSGVVAFGAAGTFVPEPFPLLPITPRDLFAAAALVGLVAHGGMPRDLDVAASLAFHLAETMLLTREGWAKS